MNFLILKKLFDAVKRLPKFIISVELFSNQRLLLSIEENVKTKDFITYTDIHPQVSCVEDQDISTAEAFPLSPCLDHFYPKWMNCHKEVSFSLLAWAS